MAKQAGKGGKTPLMDQYEQIKAQHPGAILLFRVGDFYETFGSDAVKAAEILGIVLTKRGNGSATEVELAGFPHHSLEVYLPKLVRAGQRVAICEQLEDPKETKTIVKRGVTELVTPGTSLSDTILNHKKNNYLAAVCFGETFVGIAFADVSTGEFSVTRASSAQAEQLLQHYAPAEVLFPKGKFPKLAELGGERFYTHAIDEWAFRFDFTYGKLTDHFATKSLKGFGIEEEPECVIAAGIILHYLEETRHPHIAHLNALSKIAQGDYLWLDRFSVRNLELVDSAHPDGRCFIDVLDKTQSPMGARMLRKWALFPLKQVDKILERQAIVEYFIQHEEAADALRSDLRQVGDLERLIGKSATGRINPREMVQLRKSLAHLQPIKSACENSGVQSLKLLADSINPCPNLFEKLERELNEEVPASIAKGGVIAEGVDAELDRLRKIAFSGKDYLIQLQQQEVQRTGITSLKISFNNVFGYYLEVTNTHKDKVPSDWIRKQTLVNAERYVTPELKEYEEQILGAESKISALETQLFNQMVNTVNEFIQPLQADARALGSLDCLLGFAEISIRHKYVKPQVDESFVLDIKGGRHPVIERFLPAGEDFIPNDVALDNDEQQIIVITGPNMAGKSALLRQTALIVIMAQMGCFVPADEAQIGIIDKIFTRVGASDNISSGESTFMVEMNETASILNNISARSLILLDEIGRGTSTYDGISIAWAIAEFLHQQPINRAKTLFATHYHELNEMEGQFPRIKNYNVAVKETGNKVIFLRKLQRGGSEHSFGIHVAKLAGIPNEVVDRAGEILRNLEAQRTQNGGKRLVPKKSKEMQLNMFQLSDPVSARVREAIEAVDVNTLTPLDALFTLSKLKEMMDGKS